MQMDTIGPKIGIATWEPRSGEEAFQVLAAYDRVYRIALLMTGDEEQSQLIEAATLASAKIFRDWCEGSASMLIDDVMRDRIIDRQMMIQLKAWLDFRPLDLDPQCWVDQHAEREALTRQGPNESAVRTALLLLPASERLVYVLRWAMGYSYERIEVMLNLGSPILAREAAYIALRLLREKLQEKAN